MTGDRKNTTSRWERAAPSVPAGPIWPLDHGRQLAPSAAGRRVRHLRGTPGSSGGAVPPRPHGWKERNARQGGRLRHLDRDPAKTGIGRRGGGMGPPCGTVHQPGTRLCRGPRARRGAGCRRKHGLAQGHHRPARRLHLLRADRRLSLCDPGAGARHGSPGGAAGAGPPRGGGGAGDRERGHLRHSPGTGAHRPRGRANAVETAVRPRVRPGPRPGAQPGGATAFPSGVARRVLPGPAGLRASHPRTGGRGPRAGVGRPRDIDRRQFRSEPLSRLRDRPADGSGHVQSHRATCGGRHRRGPGLRAHGHPGPARTSRAPRPEGSNRGPAVVGRHGRIAHPLHREHVFDREPGFGRGGCRRGDEHEGKSGQGAHGAGTITRACSTPSSSTCEHR